MSECIVIPVWLILMPLYIYASVSTVVYIAACKYYDGYRGTVFDYSKDIMRNCENVMWIVCLGITIFIILVIASICFVCIPYIIRLSTLLPCVVIV